MQLSGHLADGSVVIQRTKISKDGLWPFYSSLYSTGGYIAGAVQFDVSDPPSAASTRRRYCSYQVGIGAKCLLASRIFSADTRGRVQVSAERREALLSEFEKSGMSEREGGSRSATCAKALMGLQALGSEHLGEKTCAPARCLFSATGDTLA
jgi:hypothetical protein